MLARLAAVVLVSTMAASGGCRSANWRPSFGEYAAGYLKDGQEVFVYLRPHDQFTVDDLGADRLVIENLYAWTDEGKPLGVRWGQQESRAGRLFFVAADASRPARRIEVQGTVVQKSLRVRDVFRARWELVGDAPDQWKLMSFTDNIPLLQTRNVERRAG